MLYIYFLTMVYFLLFLIIGCRGQGGQVVLRFMWNGVVLAIRDEIVDT